MKSAGARVPMLEVRGFSKSYGRKKVIEDLSLEVMPGRIFGFVGPNGAGKSTLIRSIVGAQRFDGGQVLIDGMSVTEHPVRCKAVVAYVPDNPDVYDALALKTCVNGRKVYGGPARESVEKQISLIEEFVEARQ